MAVLCLPFYLAAGPAPASSSAGCAPAVRQVLRLPYRVDSILDAGPPDRLVALVAPRSGSGQASARFLPHDNLLVGSVRGRRRSVIALPRYTIPPGLASDSRAVYAVVDRTLLQVSPLSGRIEARHALDLQALGWPAAVATGPDGRIYLAGQRYGVGLPVAVVEALQDSGPGALRLIWRSDLGVTHAGIWLAPAGGDRLAVYVPNASDVTGSIAILDTASGAMRHDYPVDGPPAAADAAGERLYIEGTGTVHALDLLTGRSVAEAPGSGPVAMVPKRGLVAYTRTIRGHAGIILASARTLRAVGQMSIGGFRGTIQALAATVDGGSLLLGLNGGLIVLAVPGCAG